MSTFCIYIKCSAFSDRILYKISTAIMSFLIIFGINPLIFKLNAGIPFYETLLASIALLLLYYKKLLIR